MMGTLTTDIISNRRSLLNEAADLVDGDRNNQYGDPVEDFSRTAQYWTTYLSSRMNNCDWLHLDAHDVAVMMSLLKISRLSWSPDKRDHWVDLAGYAACGFDCVEREYDQ